MYEWTGKRWIITLSKEDKGKTFHQQKVYEKEKLLNEEKNSQIFKEIINIFPDSDLIDVRKEDE